MAEVQLWGGRGIRYRIVIRCKVIEIWMICNIC